jgi:hypothetical protein
VNVGSQKLVVGLVRRGADTIQDVETSIFAKLHQILTEIPKEMRPKRDFSGEFGVGKFALFRSAERGQKTASTCRQTCWE